MWKCRPTTWICKFWTFSHMNSAFFQPNWVFRLNYVEKDWNYAWNCPKFVKSCCRSTFWFVVKTSANNMISQIFDLFSHDSSLFQPNTPFKVNWVEKILNSCEKRSKTGKIMLSAYVFLKHRNIPLCTWHYSLLALEWCIFQTFSSLFQLLEALFAFQKSQCSPLPLLISKCL